MNLQESIRRILRENQFDDQQISLKNKIISYLNDNGIYPKSDDDIRDGLRELRSQRDDVATMFIRRISKHNR